MRGLMFNYILEYIEEHYDYETVDTIIKVSKLSNEGAYADGGMYEDADFMTLVSTASEVLKLSSNELQELCGQCSFKKIYGKLVSIYAQNSFKLETIKHAFDFIVMLEYIHYKEVVKLYPDSVFPHFDVIAREDNVMLEVRYRSERNLPYLAKGLLEGCIAYFDESMIVEMKEDISREGTHFIIHKGLE